MTTTAHRGLSFPIVTAAVDLDDEVVDLDVELPAASARILFRKRKMPLGFATVPVTNGVVSHVDIEAAAAGFRTRTVADLPRRHGSGIEFISVVVPTHRRPVDLQRLAQSLAAQSHSYFEVIVVDNGTAAPSPAAVDHLHDPRFRYIHTPIASASHARNLGLRAARADLLAMIDDDCVADPDWLAALHRVFQSRPEVDGVTGFMPSRRIDNEAQAAGDDLLGVSDWFEPNSFSVPDPERFLPFAAGQVGRGCNCAFRRDCLESVGLFDRALGPGSPAHAGEDLDLFARVLNAGYRIDYAPDALVWQDVRADLGTLQSQRWGYGVGLSAYVTKTLLRRETRAKAILSIPRGLRRLVMLERTNHDRQLPWSIRLPAVLGLFWGPFAYARGLRQVPRGENLEVLEPQVDDHPVETAFMRAR